MSLEMVYDGVSDTLPVLYTAPHTFTPLLSGIQGKRQTNIDPQTQRKRGWMELGVIPDGQTIDRAVADIAREHPHTDTQTQRETERRVRQRRSGMQHSGARGGVGLGTTRGFVGYYRHQEAIDSLEIWLTLVELRCEISML